MIWKTVKGLLILASLSLVFPLPASAVKSSPPRHKSQISSKSHKTGLKDHHHQSTAASVLDASSLRHDDDGGQHQQLGSAGKEPALVRLKRIKRQASSLRSLQQPSSSSSSSSSSSKPKYFDVVAKAPEKLNLRPIGMTEGGSFATASGPLHQFEGARVHTDMLRRLEDSNRKLPQHGGGKGRFDKGSSSKSNGISELRTGHRIQDGGRHRLAGSGNYAHHKHEQDNLDSAAAAVDAVRQRNRKKNKHQKNRFNDFSLKGTRIRNYALVPRLKSGNRVHGSETVRLPGPERSRGHAEDKGDPATEAKHRARRGQHSGMVSSNKAGSHAVGVKTELERIRRMQRDLLKEISHLEHMSKKKRRSASERLSHGQRKVLAPKRK